MTEHDDDNRPLWGITEIAPVIHRGWHQTARLLRLGMLDADKTGKRWTTTPGRLRRQFDGKRETLPT